jgi:hypothetical protein
MTGGHKKVALEPAFAKASAGKPLDSYSSFGIKWEQSGEYKKVALERGGRIEG